MRERERERERERVLATTPDPYTSEQPQSHEIALHLLSEHVSATTMLFDSRGLDQKRCREKDSHVFAAWEPSVPGSCTCLDA